MVLVTVRVLPFFVLTVVLICSVTLFVSTLGVRSYSDQRYSSMQMSTTRHSSSGSTGRAAAGASSATGSPLNRDTTRTRFSGGDVGRESGEGASTTGASAAETPARRKAASRGPRSTVAASVAGTAADATAGSLRSDVVTAATEAIACASSAPTGPASAPEIVAPRAAPRFQIVVAVFSIPDHSKPRSLAAHHPAIVTIAHNSTSAHCCGLAIARLPPFGYRKARRTAGTRQDRLSADNRFMQGKKAAGNHFPKRCCPNATRVAESMAIIWVAVQRLGMKHELPALGRGDRSGN